MFQFEIKSHDTGSLHQPRNECSNWNVNIKCLLRSGECARKPAKISKLYEILLI